MHRYEVARLTVPVAAAGQALPSIETYMASGGPRGTLRACWHSDIGALNEIMVIREFASDADCLSERERLVREGNAFGIGELTLHMALDTYTLFPFLPPIGPGADGPYYEVRSYTLRPSGLQKVMDGWQAALPKRLERSPLAAAMYALEGATPAFMHIWPYRSLDARFAIRAAAVADGVWPPKGGPDHILTMRNAIYVPAPFSPLK
jgi:hypothetical protein